MLELFNDIGFVGPKILWQIINLLILLGILAFPVWVVIKIKSIEKSLKELKKHQ